MWFVAIAFAQEEWTTPPAEIQAVLDAPELPSWEVLPGGDAVLESRPVRYPPLSELARPMFPLAGVRVNPARHSLHNEPLSTDPVLVGLDGQRTPIALPDGRRVRTVVPNADGSRLAFLLSAADAIELWVYADGALREVPDLDVNPILGAAVQWLPDQGTLLVKAIPRDLGPVPPEPLVPIGPQVRASAGARASSTYEARDLLVDAWSDALFTHFGTSQLVRVDTRTATATPIGAPDVYAGVSASPNGAWLLVQRLKAPWSHRVVASQFARDVELWTLPDGRPAKVVVSLPAEEQIPIHGEPTGPRDVAWRQSAPASLTWLEALDGGDWSTEVPQRDKMMSLAAPFDAPPTEIYRGVHRIERWWWGADGLLVVEEYERARRWRHVRTADVRFGPASIRPWFDLSSNDGYADPGWPLSRVQPDGRVLLDQDGTDVFFAGNGASPAGDRPFLDRRSLTTGAVTRLFRSAPDRLERFRGFADERHDTLIVQGESWTSPPNLYVASGPKKTPAAPGEATLKWKLRALTDTLDPTPALRALSKETVTYTRADGVPLSFKLFLPPGWRPSDGPLPTVVHAYPREFSDPETAGQVAGSDRAFLRLIGPTPLFFALHGYAVLDATTMPVLGDPDTAYDTFVEQLVASAQAAIDEAVRRGVTDRERVGVTGHSHGGLMTATLLAHSELFRAGIARSGAYNHTIRPFGFQSERRTLWEAEDTYLKLSPVMFAPRIRAPLMLIHGARDENPGTLPFQSDRLFEAIRGTGGTVRYLSLPFEGHGYQARETVLHVVAEQLAWFDRYVRDMAPPG